MKRIETPTEPGLYGFTQPHWKEISFYNVYSQKIPQSTSSPAILRDAPKVLKCKIVGSTHYGTNLKDVGADAEWYKPSLFDRIRFAFAVLFKQHNWPKRMSRVKKK